MVTNSDVKPDDEAVSDNFNQRGFVGWYKLCPTIRIAYIAILYHF